MTATRLLIDAPARGSWNMAVDEALLEAAAGGTATLRFYEWSEPTLSLGYFQAAANRQTHAASTGCPLVRRATGGGAILHHYELTYSVALPLAAGAKSLSAALYRLLHESLIEALGEWGVATELSGPKQQAGAATVPFLCFQHLTPGDVLCQGAKIAGSAQRQRRGGLLQHGSVLVRRSPLAPELPGITDLTGTALTPQELAAAWRPHLARQLPIGEPIALERRQDLARAAARIECERFASDAWNLRR